MSWNAYIKTYFTERQGVENMVSGAGIFTKRGPKGEKDIIMKCALAGTGPTEAEVKNIVRIIENDNPRETVFINGVKYYIIYKSLQPKIGHGEEKLYLKRLGGGAVIQCTKEYVIYAGWDIKIQGKYGGQQRNQNHPDTARLVEDLAETLIKSGV